MTPLSAKRIAVTLPILSRLFPGSTAQGSFKTAIELRQELEAL